MYPPSEAADVINGGLRTKPRADSLIKRSALIVVRLLPSLGLVDRTLAVAQYVCRLRRLPRLRNPSLFNDRLLKIKTDGTLRDPLRQFITDKEYVKYYVTAVAGERHTLATYQILRTPYDVDRLILSRVPCVVKPTHLSGPVLFCFGAGDELDREMLKRWLRTNYYRTSREANYRYLTPKIIVEEFFTEDGRSPPKDYKILCFHGCPKIIVLDADRFGNHTRNVYDTEWSPLRVGITYAVGRGDDPKPRQLEVMLDLARTLSKPFESIRVDMYASESEVKIGELTNLHGGANSIVFPRAAEGWLGGLFERDTGERAWRLKDEFYGRDARNT